MTGAASKAAEVFRCRWHAADARLHGWLLTILLGTGLFFSVYSTLHDYGITWDEPVYEEAGRQAAVWLKAGPSAWFDGARTRECWNALPGRNIHPSGLKWLYLSSRVVIFWESDPYRQNRTWSLLLFIAAWLWFIRRLLPGSPVRQTAATLLLVTMPRFFAHLHFAATDIPMITSLLALAAILDTLLEKRTVWLAGLVLGFSLSIKFTALVLALPLLLFMLYRRLPWRRATCQGGLILLAAGFFFFLINPAWWDGPWMAARQYVGSSISRLDWVPITTFFGGEFYPRRCPAHYPFTIFGITTPLLQLLALAAGSLWWAVDRQTRPDWRWQLAAAGAWLPFLLMVLPFSPTNDGERYLLPAYPFAALLMMDALDRAIRYLRTALPPARLLLRRTCLAILTVLGLLAAGDTIRYHPYQLSYYNSLIGGLAGAHLAGYEVAYWWEALNDDSLARIESLCRGQRVYLPSWPDELRFKHLHETRQISFSPVGQLDGAGWMLLYARPYLEYWEVQTSQPLRAAGLTARPCWGAGLDGVSILMLYQLIPAASIDHPAALPFQ